MLITLIALTTLAAEPTKIASEKGKAVEVKGKLEDGAPIENLDWAASSSMACWPATQNTKFRGPHVMYVTQLPTKSEMTITVKPDDESSDLSLWAYSIGEVRLPPEVPSCVSCEADHKWDRPVKNKTQDSSRSVKLRAIQNPYQVVIGVSGPAGAKGGYTLTVSVK